MLYKIIDIHIASFIDYHICTVSLLENDTRSA